MAAERQPIDNLDVEGIEAGEESRGGALLLHLIVLPLLLIMGAAAGTYFTGAADPLNAWIFGTGEQKGAEPAAIAEGIERRQEVKSANFYRLPDILVNLSTSSRQTQHLKIQITLELADPDQRSGVEQALPRIIDAFQVYLRELRVEDLEGSEGIYRLREELHSQINAAIAPARVNNVLFGEMMIL